MKRITFKATHALCQNHNILTKTGKMQFRYRCHCNNFVSDQFRSYRHLFHSILQLAHFEQSRKRIFAFGQTSKTRRLEKLEIEPPHDQQASSLNLYLCFSWPGKFIFKK